MLGGFPWGTLTVNVLGSLAIGALAGATPTQSWLQSAPTRAFLVVGLLGGFTTFSAFALEGMTMLQAGQPWRAMGYAAASVGLALGAAALGFSLTRG